VDALARCLQHGEEGPADVLDVHQRPPRRPVALQPDLPGGHRDRGEVVHHDVQAEPGRGAVRGGVAQVGRAEVVIGQPGQAALGGDLALAVGRDREQVRVLGHRARARGTVQAAGRGEQEARDAGLLGRLGQVQGPVEVDRVGGGGVEVAQRVVGQRGQAHHRVVAGQVRRRDIAEVPRSGVAALGRGAKVTAFVQAEIEPVDLMPGGPHERREDGADVAAVTRNEHSHFVPPVRRMSSAAQDIYPAPHMIRQVLVLILPGSTPFKT
jgi:hypothetical protein